MMYQKGAWTLHMLREMMGVETYNKGVRAYYAEYQDKNAVALDFRRHMEEASGLDLDQFFNRWLYQGGLPSLEGSWRAEDGELVIEIAQVQERYGFEISFDFDVKFADGSVERITLDVSAGQAAQAVRSIDQDVLEVVVDQDARVLARWSFGED